MSQAKKTGYQVRIKERQSCAPDKSKYNKDFLAQQSVEAENYFNTLKDRYQCYNLSKPSQNQRKAEGQMYAITLTVVTE